MKYAIINDVHIGARSDHLAVAQYQSRFFTDCFIPELEKRGVKKVLCLGDLFDRRKYVNFRTFDMSKEYLFNPLRDRGIEMDITVGNHDCFHKNTNRVNSPRLLLKDYDNITVYEDATEVVLDKLPVLYVPWICDENREHSMNMIAKTKARIAMGHLELSGYQMYLGSVQPHGMDRSVFEHFDMVMSGHYHHKSDDGKIFYLGAPCEYTWSDYNDPRGFHIFDSDTLELEHVQNPYRIFRKIFYDDRELTQIQRQKLIHEFKQTSDQYKDTFVRVMIRGKEDINAYDQFLDAVYNAQPIDVSITDIATMMMQVEAAEVDLSKDTMSIMHEHIDTLTTITDTDKVNLKALMDRTYNKALEVQDS